MRYLHQSLILAVAAAILAAWAPPALAQDADADKAKALLEQGIAEYRGLKFKEAKATLMKVDGNALPEAERKSLNE